MTYVFFIFSAENLVTLHMNRVWDWKPTYKQARDLQLYLEHQEDRSNMEESLPHNTAMIIESKSACKGENIWEEILMSWKHLGKVLEKCLKTLSKNILELA